MPQFTARAIAAAAMLGLVAAALPAAAAPSPDQANKRWKQTDECIADANRQVPDHNEEALKKRDTLVNDCLVKHHLPPRTGLASPPDGAQPDAPPPPPR